MYAGGGEGSSWDKYAVFVSKLGSLCSLSHLAQSVFPWLFLDLPVSLSCFKAEL